MPNYLKELAKRGLTLRAAAQMCGVSATHLTRVFRGRENPSAELEVELRKLFGVCPWCGSKWPHPLPTGLAKNISNDD